MERTRVRTATSADEVQIVHTVVAAFTADPVTRWCWPNAHQYLANMPAFTLAFGGGAFAHQGRTARLTTSALPYGYLREYIQTRRLWAKLSSPPSPHLFEAISAPCWSGWRTTIPVNHTG